MDGQSKIWPDFSRWPTVIITPVTSSPYHSQSNGKAEAALKIAKTMLKKVTQDNLDINLAILAWCNTPTEGSVYSPVQKLQSRRTQTQPTSSELLKPEVAKGIVVEIQHRKDKAKQQYDKTAKELPELVVGQSVHIQPTKHRDLWKKAMVMKKVGIRLYLIRTNEGQIYRPPAPNSRKTIRHSCNSTRGCGRRNNYSKKCTTTANN